MRNPCPRRATTTALLLLFVVPSLAFAGAQASPTPLPSTALRLSEILPDPATGTPEFLELWNTGNTSVALAGWKVQDRISTPATYTFSSWSLAPNARVVVWTGTNATDTPQGPKWKTTAVWNNAGDGAALLDPTGAIVDYIAYGSGGGTPPAGAQSSATSLPAPARGHALALVDGTWTDSTPSPGVAPGAIGSGISFTVANVAPTASLAAPTTSPIGAGFNVTLGATDDNGPTDLSTWRLDAGTTSIASGTGIPPARVTVTAPRDPGPFALTLTVTDAGGLSGHADATVEVSDGGLTVELPAGGTLRFPELRPGQHDIEALDTFTLRNDGNGAVVPHLDVSDFRSSTASVAVANRLWIGVAALDAQGNAGDVAWQTYNGPLTALPGLAPGAAVAVHLRLADVPTPLAAGSYGTSFAVTA